MDGNHNVIEKCPDDDLKLTYNTIQNHTHLQKTEQTFQEWSFECNYFKNDSQMFDFQPIVFHLKLSEIVCLCSS